MDDEERAEIELRGRETNDPEDGPLVFQHNLAIVPLRTYSYDPEFAIRWDYKYLTQGTIDRLFSEIVDEHLLKDKNARRLPSSQE